MDNREERKRSTNLTIWFLFLHTYGSIIDGCPNYLIILFDVYDVSEHCVCGIEMATLFFQAFVDSIGNSALMPILFWFWESHAYTYRHSQKHIHTYKSEAIEVKIILLQTIFDWYSPVVTACVCVWICQKSIDLTSLKEHRMSAWQIKKRNK